MIFTWRWWEALHLPDKDSFTNFRGLVWEFRASSGMMFLGIQVELKRRCNSFEALVDLACVEVIPCGWKLIILELSIHPCAIVHLSFQTWSKEDAAIWRLWWVIPRRWKTIIVEKWWCQPSPTSHNSVSWPAPALCRSTCLPQCPTLAFALLLNVQLEHRGGNVKQTQVGLECVVAMWRKVEKTECGGSSAIEGTFTQNTSKG